MKVLLFCLLAVYGALAQEDTTAGASVSADVSVNVSANSSSLLDKVVSAASGLTPGNVMGKMVSAVNKTMNMKNNIVNGTLGIFEDGVTMGVTAAEQGMDGAKGMLDSGISAVEKIKSTINSGRGKMINKGVDLANLMTGNKLSTIIGMANSTAHAGIRVEDKLATMGMSLASNVGSLGIDTGKNAITNIGGRISSGFSSIGKMDKGVNSYVVNKTNNIANSMSDMGQKAGNFLSSIWKMPTRSSQ